MDVLSCVFYFNSEEEPSVYVSASSTVKIERKVRRSVVPGRQQRDRSGCCSLDFDRSDR